EAVVGAPHSSQNLALSRRPVPQDPHATPAVIRAPPIRDSQLLQLRTIGCSTAKGSAIHSCVTRFPVLVLLNDPTDGPEVVLLQRSYTLRHIQVRSRSLAAPGSPPTAIPPVLPCGKQPKKLASTPAASTRCSPFRAFILASRTSTSPQLSPSGANPAPSIRSIPQIHTGYSAWRCAIWTNPIAGISTSATTGPVGDCVAARDNDDRE
ncbi:MAG: hypothetical protein QOG14_3400, partial [Mycobacterium sp.]|nr:hypothetical protein [Mycobacterium sp.]